MTDKTDRIGLINCFRNVSSSLVSEKSRKTEVAFAADQSVIEASRLVSESPTFENRILLAECLSVQGQQRLWWGKQNEECAQSYEKSLELLSQLDAESPGNQKVLSAMYTPQNNLAVVYGRLKQDSKIYPLQQMQVETLETLCARFPEIIDYHEKLPVALSKLGNAERKEGMLHEPNPFRNAL